MYNIRAPVNDLLIITPQSTCIRPRSKSLEPKRQSNLKKKKKKSESGTQFNSSTITNIPFIGR